MAASSYSDHHFNGVIICSVESLRALFLEPDSFGNIQVLQHTSCTTLGNLLKLYVSQFLPM